jgi:predicted nucleic acid-binding protein
VIIVDSTVWAAYFGGLPNAAVDRLERALLVEEDVGVLADSIPELLRGFKSETSFRTVKNILTQIPIVEPSISARLNAANLERRLRSRRVQLKRPLSCLLAQVCVEMGTPLLTSHEDMQRVRKVARFELCTG